MGPNLAARLESELALELGEAMSVSECQVAANHVAPEAILHAWSARGRD